MRPDLESKINEILSNRAIIPSSIVLNLPSQGDQCFSEGRLEEALVLYLRAARVNELLVEEKRTVQDSQCLRLRSASLYERAAHVLKKMEKLNANVIHLFKKAAKQYVESRDVINIGYIAIKIGCGYSALGDKKWGAKLIRGGLQTLHNLNIWPENSSTMRAYLCEYFYEGAGRENLKALKLERESDDDFSQR